jgi:hypothetical protein
MTTARGIDRRPKRLIDTIDDVVDDFIARCREPAREEQRWFATQSSLTAVIRTAGMAVSSPEGKRLHHQRRIPAAVLKAWTNELLENASAIRDAATFDELHCGRKSHGIGSLTVYDTAQRIGGFLKLEPDRVYLHAGTRQGAKVFHPTNRNWVLMSELPKPLLRLTPSETEDCLCLYRGEIKANCDKKLTCLHRLT